MEMVRQAEATVQRRDVSFEDGGRAAIMEVELTGGAGDLEEFVRIQSWHEFGRHPLVEQLADRRVRITIEVID